mmetsp:Transcript_12309/g.35044  ORF Transcript_12309/g.35044 Transcript_12309/m.35044 type:complete len:334 (-) Transcript_12309:422-1423(-)
MTPGHVLQGKYRKVGSQPRGSNDVLEHQVIDLVHILGRNVGVVQPLDNPRGHSDCDTVRRQIRHNNTSSPDFTVCAQHDWTEHRGPRPDQHPISNCRMPHPCPGATPTQRHMMQQRHIIANHRRLTNHHTRRVIDHQSLAQRRTGVDIDVKHLRHPGLQRHRQALPVILPHPVRYPLHLNRLKTLEKAKPVQIRLARRIPVKHSVEIRDARLCQTRVVPVRVQNQPRHLHTQQRRVRQLVGQQERQTLLQTTVHNDGHVEKARQHRLLLRRPLCLPNHRLPQRVLALVPRPRRPLIRPQRLFPGHDTRRPPVAQPLLPQPLIYARIVRLGPLV